MNSIKTFIQEHPDMKFIVGMYLMGSKEQYGDDCLFEIAVNEDEENEFVRKHEVSGYTLVDGNYFGNFATEFRACFMVFKKKKQKSDTPKNE